MATVCLISPFLFSSGLPLFVSLRTSQPLGLTFSHVNTSTEIKENKLRVPYTFCALDSQFNRHVFH